MNRPYQANIPTKLASFSIYDEGNQLQGVEAEIEMPTLTAATNEISGPGIAGVINDPTPGLFDSMEIGLTFRNVSDNSISLCEPRGHMLSLYADQRSTNRAGGFYVDEGMKITMRGYPKEYSLGKAKAGESTSTSIKFELDYLKVEVDGKTKLEVDKVGFIYVVDGVDYLEQVRRNI